MSEPLARKSVMLAIYQKNGWTFNITRMMTLRKIDCTGLSIKSCLQIPDGAEGTNNNYSLVNHRSIKDQMLINVSIKIT